MDLIQNATRYLTLDKGVRQALLFLQDKGNSKLVNGECGPVAPNFTAIYTSYSTKPPAECVGEIHRHTMDIHYIVAGGEFIGYAASNWESLGEYNAQTDNMFIRGAMSMIRATASIFVIFDAGEAHQPGIICPEFESVQKIIIKISQQGAL